jgi:hypothetical protein
MSDVSMNRMEEDCSSVLRKIEDLKEQLSGQNQENRILMLSLALAWLPFYYSSLSEASTCFAEKRKT